MTALLLRELFVMSKRTSFAMAACTFASLSIGFAVSWPNGIPLYAGASLFAQLAIVLQLAVAVMAPWVICRCGTQARGNAFVHLSVFSAVPPSRIVLARFLASVTALVVLALGALPVVVYAQQTAVETPSTVVAVFIEMFATIAAAAAWTLAVQQSIRSYVGTWLVATVASIALSVLAHFGGNGGVLRALTLLVSIACLSLAAARADVTSRYLVEEDA
jgi:hypothetical protein